MAKMSVVVRAIRPADQKLGALESRLINGLTIAVAIFVIALVIVVIVISNWGETVVLKGSVKIENWVYDDELGDGHSLLFADKSSRFCNDVTHVYIVAEKCAYYRGCRVLAFREGSVIVDFEITIDSSLVEKQKDIMDMSEVLILALLKKPGASQAFTEYSIDEYKIRLPGVEKHIEQQVDTLPTATDICTAWQQMLAAKTKTTTDKQCEKGWLRYENSCYCIFTERKSYRTYAENYCTGKQSHLVFIESEEEENFIEEAVNDLDYTLKFFWLGAIRDPVTTRFKWVDYSRVNGKETVTPMCYRKWQIGQPNNYGNEQNYVALINHAWDDVIGYPKRFFFICEKDLLVGEKVWEPPDWSLATPPPASLVISSHWPTQVTLSWRDYAWNSGRQEGVYTLVYYENIIRPADHGFIASGDTSITVSPLAPSSMYRMAYRTIRYKAADQTSHWYDIQTVGTTVSELGLAPSNISVQTLDSGSLLISWDIPDEISSNVTAYTINVWHDDAMTRRMLRSERPSINVSGLDPGLRFYIQVFARTESTYYASPRSVYRTKNGWQSIKNARLLQLCGTHDVVGSVIIATPTDLQNATFFTTSSFDQINDTFTNNTDFDNTTSGVFNNTTTSGNVITTTDSPVSPEPEINNKPTNTSGLPEDCEDATCQITTWIRPRDGQTVQVYCDNGWTIIHRIGPNDTAFSNRTWTDYKNGFGNRESEHWIGNENIYRLTNRIRYRLRIEIESSDNVIRTANYDSFLVESEDNFYRLHVDGFSGNGSMDAFQVPQPQQYENGRLFAARESGVVSPCPALTDAGWWFSGVCQDYLTGHITGDNSINWGGVADITTAVMKIKRNNS